MADELAPDCIFEEEREEGREKPAAPFWTVAIYLCDRAYGGPEEGGWWYDYGERVDQPLEGIKDSDLLNVLPNELQAQTFAALLQVSLDKTVNVGRRDISSVLSTGRYYAQVYNGHPPAFYPERRPHYE